MTEPRHDDETTTPELDPATASSMLEDPDFAGEHTRPTVADEQPGGPHRGPDESEPDGTGGDGGMDP